MLALEVRRRQAVGDEDDLPVRRVLRRQELPGQSAGACWMFVKCGGIMHLADVRIAHVGLQPHHRVVDRHRLGHQRGDLARRAAAWRTCTSR